MDNTEKLKAIKPGKTYPSYVTITEEVEGKTQRVKFLLQSYVVGMYCAIHVGEGGGVPHQAGDHDNAKLVRALKKDIGKAIERGATVEIGSIQDVKTM